ncbi:MAG: hypothetical protein ABFS39_03100 [Pseudomonadota bacterium]
MDFAPLFCRSASLQNADMTAGFCKSQNVFPPSRFVKIGSEKLACLILQLEAATAFSLGPLPILLRTMLFRFGHYYSFEKY